MEINDALSHKAARRDAVAKLKSFRGSASELQTHPMAFHTLLLLTACAIGRFRFISIVARRLIITWHDNVTEY